jgi:hypothetical protein
MFRSPLACQTNRHASLSAPFADFGRLNRRTAVKSLLNRRHVLAGPSHLVHDVRASASDPASSDDDEPAAADDSSAGSAALDAAPRPVRPVSTLRPVPVVPAQVGVRGVQIADIAEVEWLAEEEALAPFRVFRSFDYSVSLLFHAKELTYYVALYEDGSLWRADGETRRAQLEAQNEQLARMIARSEAQAERLRSDLQRRGTHEQAVSNRQHQVRKEVSQLEAQRVAAQAHLNKAHRQIHQLNLTSNEAIPHLPNR